MIRARRFPSRAAKKAYYKWRSVVRKFVCTLRDAMMSKKKSSCCDDDKVFPPCRCSRFDDIISLSLSLSLSLFVCACVCVLDYIINTR
jgi:hypothetical protein